MEDPHIAKEMAYKIRNMQKTFWAIKRLEKKIAEEDAKGGWDPRLYNWTNW